MKSKKRIAHLCNVSTKVGAITSVSKILNNFDSINFELCAITYGEDVFHKFDVDTYHCNLKTYRLLSEFSHKNISIFKFVLCLLPYFISDIILLRRVLKKNEIYCIHTHYIIDNFLVAFLGNKIKKIAHIRSIPNRNFLKGIGVGLFSKVIKMSNTTLIGISKVVLECFDIVNDKYVVYNGYIANSDKYKLNQEQKNNLLQITQFKNQGKFVVGAVSRFNHNKGLSLFIEIADRLKDNENIVFVIVAPLSSKTEKEFFLNLDLVSYSNVFYAGSFPHADYFMNCFDLLLHCTLDREGFGNVVLEAILNKIPVISTDCGGPSEIIENNINGMILGKDDVDKFVDTICELCLKGDKYTFFQKNCNDFVINNKQFEFDETIKRLEYIYSKKMS